MAEQNLETTKKHDVFRGKDSRKEFVSIIRISYDFLFINFMYFRWRSDWGAIIARGVVH